MSMAMSVVDDAPVAAEIADIVDCVFRYLFIFVIIKFKGVPTGKRVGTSFHENMGPNKIIFRVKNHSRVPLGKRVSRGRKWEN